MGWEDGLDGVSVLVKRRRETRACSLSLPYEDTAKRWPSARQKKSPH